MRRSLLVLVVLAFAAPAGAAEGERILFTSERTGSVEVYATGPGGGRLEELTFAGTPRDLCSPAPSPNGKRIVYVVGSLYSCFSGPIVVVDADGRHARRIAYGADPSWSRDSKRIVYAAQGIRIINASGTGDHLVLTAEGTRLPSFSPDGRSIAFVRDGEESRMLAVLRGGAERPLAAGVVGQPAWSPDGRWIAFLSRSANGSEERVALVRPSDGHTRRLAARPFGFFPVGPVWSPDGRMLAFTDSEHVQLFTLANSRIRSIATGTGTSDIAWSPRSDAIALGEVRGVTVVPLRGRARRIFAEPSSPYLTRHVAWTTPPRSTRYRPASVPPALARAAPTELDVRYPVDEIAADGGRAVYVTCGRALGVWQPGASSVVPLGPHSIAFCRTDAESPSRRSLIALAGSRALYLLKQGGISVFYSLRLATLGERTDGIVLIAGSDCCSGDPLLPPVGYMHGDGDLLVFSTWEKDRTTGRLASQAIWRVQIPTGAGKCGDLDGPCALVAEAAGTLEPLDVDAGRILVLRAGGELDVFDSGGSVVRAISVAPANVVAAELDGNDVVAVTRGQVLDYDLTTGALAHTWPLPDVTTGPRTCNRFYCPTSTPTLRVVGAAHGVVAYMSAGAVHLLRLRDGADVVAQAATDAALDPSGLFWSSRGPDPWPGRIGFLPTAALPLRS